MWLRARERCPGGSPPPHFLPPVSTPVHIMDKLRLCALVPRLGREGTPTSGGLALSLTGGVSTLEPVRGLALTLGMEVTDSKCPPTPQVRRGHPTVHSETKYVELIVVNDHQLVRSQPGGNSGRGHEAAWPSAHSLSSQFEQMRQSVVLTSNFAKSVVNLADVVSCLPSLSAPLPPPPQCPATHMLG